MEGSTVAVSLVLSFLSDTVFFLAVVAVGLGVARLAS